jgi:probable rRNA maturation factor
LQKKSLIRFNHDNFITLPEADLLQWLMSIAVREGYTIEEMEYNFVDADTLFRLNKEYLNHDTDTDIITFDYSDSKAIKAEVYISCDALKTNAEIHAQTAESECLRLLSHALLHCMGYNDKTNEEKEHMRLKEEDCINLFHVKH